MSRIFRGAISLVNGIFVANEHQRMARTTCPAGIPRSSFSYFLTVSLFLAQHRHPTGIFAAWVCDNYTTGRGTLGATEQVSIKIRVARSAATRRSLMSRVTYPPEAEATTR